MIRSDYVRDELPLPGPLRLDPLVSRSRGAPASSAPLEPCCRVRRTRDAARPSCRGSRGRARAGWCASWRTHTSRRGRSSCTGPATPSSPRRTGPFVEALEHLVKHATALELRDALERGAGELTRLLPELPARSARRSLALPATPTPSATGCTAPSSISWRRQAGGRRSCSCSRTCTGPTLPACSSSGTSSGPAPTSGCSWSRRSATRRPTFRSSWPRPSSTSVARRASCGCDSAGSTGGEVAEFVRLVTGVEASAQMTATIEALTDGNAFLLTELWRELRRDRRQSRSVSPAWSSLGVDWASSRTPETVREVVSASARAGSSRNGELLELGGDRGLGVRARHRPARRRGRGGESARRGRRGESAAGCSWRHRACGSRTASRTSSCAARSSTACRAPRRADLHLRVADALERDAGER